MRRPGLPDNRDYGAPTPTGNLDSLDLAKLLLAGGEAKRADRMEGNAIRP
jgi:hypothetical protein